MADPGRIIELFTEASQLPTERRPAFLERVCGDDKELRGEIEALLNCNDRAGTFLEEPPTALEGRADALVVGEKPGDRVDRYVLLEQIGEGGCGVVFMAEQREPVQRRVALKVVKPGMDTKSVIARFEAERQALALMDHPNIAHVFDAGVTGGGRPYFVMELVRGVKITDFCDQQSLPIAARLELFIHVCSAIQHAHQKGIVHRDIKPSNILVATGADGKATPKVIDFGIAKAISGLQLTNKTIFTGHEMLIGTPSYMSPEQAKLTSGDVDTRSDIYSLGVLLYELLTGTTPFDTRELMKAGLDEVRRVIGEQEPVRPSTRLSTMIAANLTGISQHRQAEPPRLIRQVQGDLDWIVMTALEKDRRRRYQTADALAGDVRRYLGNEMVAARPPSRVYKFQKLVTRHKLGFAASGIILATLVAALTVTSWSLRRALDESARSREAANFIDDMMQGITPAATRGRDTSLLREIFDRAAERMDQDLVNRPGALADLRVTMGRAYGGLGLWDKEEPLLRAALAYYSNSPAGSGEKIADALAAMSIMNVNMNVQRRDLSKVVEAEQEARQALAIYDKVLGDENMKVVGVKTRLGWVLLQQKKYPEAAPILRDALATGRRLHQEDSDTLLDARNGLAGALMASSNFDEAESLTRESLSVAITKYGTNHVYTANCLGRLGLVCEQEQKFAEAETVYRQRLAIYRKILPPDHPLIDAGLETLGGVLENEQKIAQEADICGQLLEFRRKYYRHDDDRTLRIVRILAEIFLTLHDEARFKQLAAEFPEAWVTRSEFEAKRAHWPQARAAAAKFLELEPDDDKGYHLMAPLLVQAGDRAAYEDLCVKMTGLFAATTNAHIADRVAKDCLTLPRPGADLTVPAVLAERAVTLGQEDSGALPFIQSCKALAEYRQGDFAEAAKWASLAVKNDFPYSKAEANAILAMALLKSGQPDDARAALADCDKVIDKELPSLAQGDLGIDWRDWIIAHALQKEARSQIEAATPAAGARAEK